MNTEQLREEIEGIVREAINCNALADTHQLGQDFTNRILTACKKAGLAFVVKDEIPKKMPSGYVEYPPEDSNELPRFVDGYVSIPGYIRDYLHKERWRQTKEIEVKEK